MFSSCIWQNSISQLYSAFSTLSIVLCLRIAPHPNHQPTFRSMSNRPMSKSKAPTSVLRYELERTDKCAVHKLWGSMFRNLSLNRVVNNRTSLSSTLWLRKSSIPWLRNSSITEFLSRVSRNSLLILQTQERIVGSQKLVSNPPYCIQRN